MRPTNLMKLNLMKMISCKSPGLRLITVAFLLLYSIGVNAQDKAKKDTSSYTLTEPQVLLISQLLSYGDSAAGNSDKISTRDYNNFHYQVLKVDSILRVQYTKKHPVKKDAKKP